MSEMNRRQFVAAAGAAAVSLYVLSEATELFAADAPATIDVGAPADYPKDGITAKWIKSKKFAIVRENGKLYAVSTKCTHKGCTVNPAGDHFVCPCHRAQYHADGSVLNGGGKTDTAMFHYGLATDSNGHLIVDTSKHFEEKQWDDPASYVAIASDKSK